MTTTKEELIDILHKLDNTDDANWTEDGAPMLDVVQLAADDKTITRDDINAAIPGFARQVPGTVKNKGAPRADGSVKEVTTTTGGKRAEESVITREYTDDEMRAILDRRVAEAERNLIAAQKAQSEATQEVTRCQQRLARAHRDHQRQFPPVTAAQAIKDHLASQQRQRMIAAGLDPEAAPAPAPARNVIGTPLDVEMQRRTNRGNGTGTGRPTRPVMDGRLVLAKTA